MNLEHIEKEKIDKRIEDMNRLTKGHFNVNGTKYQGFIKDMFTKGSV